MKTKVKFLVYSLAVIAMSMFVIVGCSDDDTEPKYDIIHGDGVIDIDGNEYTTVIIGDQEWMAENLRASRYNNGDDIPTGLSDTEWENTTNGASAIFPHTGGCWHGDEPVEGINSDAEMVAAYGKLYNWYAATDPRELCPEGWRLPSYTDWTRLLEYVVSHGFPNDDDENPNGAGNALKSCRQIDSSLGGDCDTSEHPRWGLLEHEFYGFNEFGFSALPGGWRGIYGYYALIGYFGFWWSSTEYSSTSVWNVYVGIGYGNVSLTADSRSHGYSIRCVRD